ncbi:HAD family hydrolase [Phaeacidiphilus oryzae]|uniref:HAD family hydrolase n=1 Tax=Phaeacidiphilus oryzae TaxID=348818 RepID=UPI00055CF825|nr:HAD family hydrolase [Phaeacidiphilus oryzae]
MSEPTQPPQRPRIIATDLDGTLLRSDGTVSPRTRAALGRAEDAGLCIVFVTGRPPRWMESLTEVIGRHGVAICSNGGAVYDVRRRRLQRSYPLSAADSLAVVRALRAGLPGVTFAFEYPGGFSHEPDYPAILWDAGAAEQVAPAERLLGSGGSGSGCGGEAGVFKILAKHPTLTPDEFLAAGRGLVGDLAEVTRSSPIALLEISAAGVSKASTLAAWCAERGVSAEEVAAFGDMPNDLPMLAWAGAAYAVANAHPEVLAATRRRAESNDQDGVAKVLERLLLPSAP